MTSAAEILTAIGSNVEVRLYDDGVPLITLSESARKAKARQGIRLTQDDLDELRSNFALTKSRRAVWFFRGEQSAGVHHTDFDSRSEAHGEAYTLTTTQAAMMPTVGKNVMHDGVEPAWKEIFQEYTEPTTADLDLESLIVEARNGSRRFKKPAYNDRHFQPHQYATRLKGSKENRPEGTDDINVPSTQDETPAALLPLVANETYTGTTPHVLRERVYFANSSAVVYSPIATEAADLPHAWYHETSWAPERTMKSRTIYFTDFHEHPVTLGKCQQCKPVMIDRTLKLREYDASHFTFKKPKRPDQVMPSDLRNILIASEKSPLPDYSHRYGEGRKAWLLIPAQEPFDERINALETLCETTQGGPLSPQAKERQREDRLNEIASGKWGNYANIMEPVTEMVRMGADYVPGTFDFTKILNARGRAEARLNLIESENQEVKEMAEQLNVKPNTLTKRKQRALARARTVERIAPAEVGANILAKLTQSQVDDINEQGGVIALRWTGGKHVALQPFPQGGLVLLSDAGTPDGREDWMLAAGEVRHKNDNLIDVVCDIARRHDAYEAYKANLPRGKRSDDAWKTDLRALAIAKRQWSKIVVFNFGAPGWLTRYKSWTPEQKESFVESGYSPKPLES
jgi:hypothetical protein